MKRRVRRETEKNGGERVESFTGDYYGRIAKRCTVTRARSAVEYIIFLNHGYTRSGVAYRKTHAHAYPCVRARTVLVSRTSRTYIHPRRYLSYIGKRTRYIVRQHACSSARSLARDMHDRTYAACKCRITRSLRVQDGPGKCGRRRRGV